MNNYHVYENGKETRRFIRAAYLEIREDGIAVFYDDKSPQQISGISKNYDFIILLED